MRERGHFAILGYAGWPMTAKRACETAKQVRWSRLASGDNFSGFFSYSTQNTLQIIALLERSQKHQKNSNLTNNDKIVVKYLG
jgi:hypothetical protein